MFDTGKMSAFLFSELLADPEPFDDLPLEDELSEMEVSGSDLNLQALPSTTQVHIRQATELVSPTELAVHRSLPVAKALEGLLPDGLRRGSTVGLSGIATRSLALALVSQATETGSWVAVVGGEDLGLLAAVEFGVSLERLVVVDLPSPTLWASTLATLVSAIDLVLVTPAYRPSEADARRLAARCREQGSVLLYLDSLWDRPSSVSLGWPGRLDLVLTVTEPSWEGFDCGVGAGGPIGCSAEGAKQWARLCARRVEVVARGRGLPPDGRWCELLLPGPNGVPVRL